MTKVFFATLLSIAALSVVYSQNLDFHEDFSNYNGNQNPYSVFVSWNTSNTSSATLNGNAIELSNGGSSIEAPIPGGLSQLRCLITGSKTNSSLLITVTDSTNNVLYQSSFHTTKNQNTEVLIPIITPETVSTLRFENTTSGGGNNKNITIDDISWNGFSIYDLQYTTDPSGDSPQKNNVVSTSGTVTALNSTGYYIQEADGSLDGTGAADWGAIYVEDANLTPNILDIVAITGTINESTGKTTVSVTGTGAYDASIINSGGGNEPVANLIIASLTEKDESVLSTIRDSRYVEDDYNSGLYTMSIGFDQDESKNPLIPIDNDIITTTEPVLTPRLYDITGPVNFNSSFRISPRDGFVDIYQGIDLATTTASNNPSNSSVFTRNKHIIVLSESANSIHLYNAKGEMIQKLTSLQGRTEIRTKKGLYIVKIVSEGKQEITKVIVL